MPPRVHTYELFFKFDVPATDNQQIIIDNIEPWLPTRVVLVIQKLVEEKERFWALIDSIQKNNFHDSIEALNKVNISQNLISKHYIKYYKLLRTVIPKDTLDKIHREIISISKIKVRLITT